MYPVFMGHVLAVVEHLATYVFKEHGAPAPCFDFITHYPVSHPRKGCFMRNPGMGNIPTKEPL